MVGGLAGPAAVAANQGLRRQQKNTAVQELVTLGYGAVKLEKLLTYRSLKEIAKWSRRIILSYAGAIA